MEATAGTPITAEQAQKYIEAQIALNECLQSHLSGDVTSGQAQDQTTKDMNTFYSSKANAFIFDKSLVTRFFPEDNGAPEATYLMVIIGAKPADDLEHGNPTVIVAGVNDNGKGGFLSLPIAFPATEQPPRHAIAKFPDHGLEGFPQIEFTIENI